MDGPAGDTYVNAFRTRCRDSGRPVVDQSGVCGMLPTAEVPRLRLLVTDDRAYAELAGLLRGAGTGVIDVVVAAARCARLVETRCPTWTAKPTTAMARRDLAGVPELDLPDGLTLRPVRRLHTDPRDGVPLEDAVDLAVLADPSAPDRSGVLAGYLRSLPPAYRLFAATDAAGTVRATCGGAVFGDQVGVIFVNTHPAWRRRGVGRAMTAAWLRAARDAGGRQACLDASAAARSVYRRLGFEEVAAMTQFSSAD